MLNDDIGRINYPVIRETVVAIHRVAEREGVCPSEALRRLVAWGDKVYKTIAINDGVVTIIDDDGEQVVWIDAKRGDDV